MKRTSNKKDFKTSVSLLNDDDGIALFITGHNKSKEKCIFISGLSNYLHFLFHTQSDKDGECTKRKGRFYLKVAHSNTLCKDMEQVFNFLKSNSNDLNVVIVNKDPS